MKNQTWTVVTETPDENSKHEYTMTVDELASSYPWLGDRWAIEDIARCEIVTDAPSSLLITRDGDD